MLHLQILILVDVFSNKYHQKYNAGTSEPAAISMFYRGGKPKAYALTVLLC